MTGKRDAGGMAMVPRSVAFLILIVAMLCVLAMARHTDREIRRAGQDAQEAEARSAAAISRLIKTKDLYTRTLEELRSCGCRK